LAEAQLEALEVCEVDDCVEVGVAGGGGDQAEGGLGVEGGEAQAVADVGAGDAGELAVARGPLDNVEGVAFGQGGWVDDGEAELAGEGGLACGDQTAGGVAGGRHRAGRLERRCRRLS
jgi:hypothetical protein